MSNSFEYHTGYFDPYEREEEYPTDWLAEGAPYYPTYDSDFGPDDEDDLWFVHRDEAREWAGEGPLTR